jgi:putative dimethyl sulfoxide reductase chaperone
MNIKLKAGLQSEFYLCLARAFLAPQHPASFDAMTRFLAEDLAELNESLDYPIVEELAILQHELARVSSSDMLLGIYSQLFLNPASRIPINTGIYIDGAMMGGTVARMEECYSKSGLEKSDGFRDLADHVAVQLEFVSHLFAHATDASAMQGSDFLHVFVAAWAPRLSEEIEDATRRLALPTNPYLPLARIVEIAAESDAAAVSAAHAEGRKQTAIEKARAKRAESGIADEDMQAIEQKLRERGLATSHLRIPVDGRDAAMGMTRGTLPEPRRKM